MPVDETGVPLLVDMKTYLTKMIIQVGEGVEKPGTADFVTI